MEGLTDWTADGQTDRPFQSMSNRSHSNWNLIPSLPDCSFSPQLHRPVTAPSSEPKPTTTPWELFARPGLLDIISLVFHRARLLCTITWLTDWVNRCSNRTRTWIFNWTVNIFVELEEERCWRMSKKVGNLESWNCWPFGIYITSFLHLAPMIPFPWE